MDWNIVKEKIAEAAIFQIPTSGIIGLGSGTTSKCFIQALAQQYAVKKIPIRCVATSKETEVFARNLGLPLISEFDWNEPIEVTFDGADAIDEEGTAIKGAGGALLREKIVAFHSKKLILMVDERKWKKPWHEVLLPLEVIRFGLQNTIKTIKKLGLDCRLRYDTTSPYLTSDNNNIVDLSLPKGENPSTIEAQILSIPGVIDTGLFYHFASEIIIGYGNGVIEKRQVTHVSRFCSSLF